MTEKTEKKCPSCGTPASQHLAPLPGTLGARCPKCCQLTEKEKTEWEIMQELWDKARKKSKPHAQPLTDSMTEKTDPCGGIRKGREKRPKDLTMTPDLERIEALAQAATAGPWNSSREDMDSYLGNGTFVCYVYRGERERIGVIAENAREDARFIAAANPQTVLALVARVRELEAASKSLTEERRKEICGMQDLLDAQAGDIRTLQARVREMSVRSGSSGRNYVADDEVFPQRVEFENGRIVEIAYENGKPFLRVSLKERSE